MIETNSEIEKLVSGQVLAIMGGQWGDEGKGKLVDILGGQYNIIARCAGGSNAGHTVIVEGVKYAFHLMPSGILHPTTVCLVGNGVVLHLPTLFEELKSLDKQGIEYKGRIYLSDRAHIVFDFHQEIDVLQEDAAAKSGPKDTSIGTTKRGIGPAYASKAARRAIRVGDLRFPDTLEGKLQSLVDYWKQAYPINVDVKAVTREYLEYYERIKEMIVDSVEYINTAFVEGKRIMIEGANATMLDIDFGTWPYVTSSNASIGGAITGLGIAPKKISGVVGIMKAYTTRVGAGPFPTELKGELGTKMRETGGEYGTTTGRPRRCGWIDIVAMKYTHIINDYSAVNLTKLDVLSDFDELKIGVAYKYRGHTLALFPSNLEILSEVEVVYETFPGWKQSISHVRLIEDLPPNALAYINRIEALVGCRTLWVGVGPGREAMAIHKSS